MEKLIKDGMVAVLYSPGFGAGWHTWGAPVEAIFDPALATAVLMGDTAAALHIAKEKWPNQYTGGVDDLVVGWVPVGTAFRINEYDGSESLVLMDKEDYIVA